MCYSCTHHARIASEFYFYFASLSIWIHMDHYLSLICVNVIIISSLYICGPGSQTIIWIFNLRLYLRCYSNLTHWYWTDIHMGFFSYVFILSDSLLILQVMEHFTSEKPVIYHQVYIHIGLKIQKPKVGTSSGAQEKN